jgi:hypothetical protein
VRLRLPLVAAALLLAVAPSADAQRWRDAGRSVIPIDYFQGVTSNPAGDLWFDGISFGLYSINPQLVETGRVPNVIPTDVSASEGYNHIGDISYSRLGVLLPLECYDPRANPTNTCGTGSIGVADPATLAWRYYVKLDPADIPKAMWCEVSPDGKLVWTSSGNDLLAYSTADLSIAHAAVTAAPIRPVQRLAGAVPPSGITGATLYAGRLFVAGAVGTTFQVWSVDTSTGRRRLEIERQYSGESEGLDSLRGLGGTLHWQIQPITDTPPPTFAEPSLLHFLPTPAPKLTVSASPRTLTAGDRARVRITVRGAWRAPDNPLPGAHVGFGGTTRTTDARGRTSFTIRPKRAGKLKAVARALGEAPGKTTLIVR